MTEIKGIQAGAELDQLVAKNVMRWAVVDDSMGDAVFLSSDRVIYTADENVEFLPGCFSPSRRMDSALEVMARFVEGGQAVSLQGNRAGWQCSLGSATDSGATAMLAVCNAALRAARPAESRSDNNKAP